MGGFIVAYAPINDAVQAAGGWGQVFKDNAVNGHVFIGLGILSQAMTCHPVALMVNESLHEKTSSKWAAVTNISLSVAWLLCSIMGTFGFLGFLDETKVRYVGLSGEAIVGKVQWWLTSLFFLRSTTREIF